MHDIPGLEPTAEAATQGAIATPCVDSVPTTDVADHETTDNAAVDDDSGAAKLTGNDEENDEEDDEENDEEDDEEDGEENDEEDDDDTDDDDDEDEESDGFPRPDRVAFWEQWRWTRRRCRACDCCERPCRYGPYQGW